jgi:hypothetical protein
MNKFYYIVRGATNGDNVGEYEAADKDVAIKELNDLYAVEAFKLKIELITQAHYNTEKKRIQAARLEEANRVEDIAEA